MRIRHPLAVGATVFVAVGAAGLGTFWLQSRINILPLAFRPAELTEDFDILRLALEEAHPGLYRYTSKPDLDRLFAQARKQLNHGMTSLEFYRLLAPVIAQIRCGHTILRPAPRLNGELFGGDKVFPFGVRIRGGRVYIFDDFATPDQALAGAEVLSINGVPASRILAVMLAGTSGDGNIVTGKSNLIGRGHGGGFFRALFSPSLSAMLGIEEPFVVTYRALNRAEEQTITVKAQRFRSLVKQNEAKYPLDARPPRLPDGRVAPPRMPNFLDGGRIAIWKFPGFGGYTDADRQGAFIDTAFRMIRERGSVVLILDNRNNGGGRDSLGARLFSYFAEQRFQYYKDLIASNITFKFVRYVNSPDPFPSDEFSRRPDGRYEWVKHPNWGTLEPREPHFSGKTYVLIDGGCYSTCSEFISTMHYYKKAVFLGEEVGGDYYGNSSGIRYLLTLPHTKLELELPVVGYYLNVSGYSQWDRGVMPDLPIDPEISDLLAGKDPVLDRALSFARAR